MKFETLFPGSCLVFVNPPCPRAPGAGPRIASWEVAKSFFLPSFSPWKLPSRQIHLPAFSKSNRQNSENSIISLPAGPPKIPTRLIFRLIVSVFAHTVFSDGAKGEVVDKYNFAQYRSYFLPKSAWTVAVGLSHPPVFRSGSGGFTRAAGRPDKTPMFCRIRHDGRLDAINPIYRLPSPRSLLSG